MYHTQATRPSKFAGRSDTRRSSELGPTALKLLHINRNAAAYLFHNASQVPQNLATLVAPTAGRWPYRSLAKLVAPSLSRVSLPPANPIASGGKFSFLL